ncbi:hypothetical protein [Paenochrobactrum pullorum]|uniref:hypothetical protein n=1 Tax=Paenochrobactrum pullorum TaxID=1324351 RepID=UPI0035BBF74B
MQQKADGSDEKENAFSSKRYDDTRKAESEDILARIKLETGSGATGVIARSFNRGREHLKASDLDAQDRVEVWATRFGRILGLIIMLAMMVWLVLYLLQV